MKCVAPIEVGITACKLDELLSFYTDILEFSVISDITVPEANSKPTGISPFGYRVIRLESNLGDRIKLAAPTEGAAAAPPGDFALQRRGTHYITFIVDDLEGILDRLVAANVKVVSQGRVEVRPGVSLALIQDPEGNFLEFVEYADLNSYRPGLQSAHK